MNAINIEVGQTLKARLREAISLSNPFAVSIWYDSLADDVSEKNTGVTFNGTTDIILVDAPLQSVPVVVTEITIVNNDSVSHTFDWFLDDGVNEFALPAFSLEAGQAWYMSSAESTHAVVEADPLFSLWLGGDPRLSNWEVDGANGLKPKDGKTVDGEHISGTIYGGLFQP